VATSIQFLVRERGVFFLWGEERRGGEREAELDLYERRGKREEWPSSSRDRP